MTTFGGRRLLSPVSPAGKHLVFPTTGDPLKEPDEDSYPTFVYGLDPKTGAELEYTCEEAALSNHFGANHGAPHYLTPITSQGTY